MFSCVTVIVACPAVAPSFVKITSVTPALWPVTSKVFPSLPNSAVAISLFPTRKSYPSNFAASAYTPSVV